MREELERKVRSLYMRYLRMDYQRYVQEYELNGSLLSRWRKLLFGSTFPVVVLFRLSAGPLPLKILAIPLYKLARILSGVQIPRSTRIGGGLLLPHFGSIVVNGRAVIGSNVVIQAMTSMAAKGSGDTVGVPVVGDDVYIGIGSILVGEVEIGPRTMIGAGAVVTKSFPGDVIIAGNPAKQIGVNSKRGIVHARPN